MPRRNRNARPIYKGENAISKKIKIGKVVLRNPKKKKIKDDISTGRLVAAAEWKEV